MADDCLSRFEHLTCPDADGSDLQSSDLLLTGNRANGGAETFWTPPFGTRQVETEEG